MPVPGGFFCQELARSKYVVTLFEEFCHNVWRDNIGQLRRLWKGVNLVLI
jgi:hypothetical protein